jgi:sulfur relay (sulfurtransferase) DsrF/TusC family protein
VPQNINARSPQESDVRILIFLTTTPYGYENYAHAQALQTRGLTQADLVPGCHIVDDARAAELMANADATFVY